jgi:PadR family transcriptional regulator, regulatory protein PadR
MDNTLKQGTLDLVLLSVLEKVPLYGLEILKEVNTRTEGAFDFKEGSLYPALHRLVKASWIESEWQPSTTGGAPRKYYRLTDSGQAALQKKKGEWAQLRDALNRLMLRPMPLWQHQQGVWA